MPLAYLDADGPHVAPLQDWVDDMIAAYHAHPDLSPTADLSENTSMGKLIRIKAKRLYNAAMLAKSIHDQSRPRGARGRQANLIALITGTRRRPATRGYLLSTQAGVYLRNGATLAAGALANVLGQPENRWRTMAAVTNDTGGDTWVPCAFQAENTGAILCPASELRVVAEPMPGWINDPVLGYAVNNSNDATLGRADETDEELDERRRVELYQGGSATVRAIRANLSALEGMVWVVVLENDTDYVNGGDGHGISAHSVAPVVYDGTDKAAPSHNVTDEAIAACLFRTCAAAGIRTWGEESATVTDSKGHDHTVYWTRANELSLWIDVDFDGNDNDSTYAGDDAVKAALVAWGLANLGMDNDVRSNRLAKVVMGLQGVVDIAGLRIGWSNPPGTPLPGTLAVGWAEVAKIDSGRITVSHI